MKLSKKPDLMKFYYSLVWTLYIYYASRVMHQTCLTCGCCNEFPFFVLHAALMTWSPLH